MQSTLPNFDSLVEMAQKSPEKFESLRTRMIKEVIDGARGTCKQRLKGLQFNIDMEIRRAKTSMASCIKISQMMHESLAQLQTHLDVNNAPAEPQKTKPATVICFNAGKEKLKDKALMVN